MALFDLHVAVDWSAAGTPRQGQDSIWIAVAAGGVIRRSNPPTRSMAVADLSALLSQATAAGQRVLIGVDFSLGYPRGLAHAIRPDGDWRDVWARIGELVEEGPDNRTNRFDAAAKLNALFSSQGPFWGNGLAREIPDLPRHKPTGWGETLPVNRRRADVIAKSAQEVWKLSGIGSVGSQALTGIAALVRLRADHGLAIWPFEQWQDGHVVVEIYPSLLPLPDHDRNDRDAVQVDVCARTMAKADTMGLLGELLSADLTDDERVHEGMILGLTNLSAFRVLASPALASPALASPVWASGALASLLPTRPAQQPMRPYEKDPAAIYVQSFATVRAEARLERFPPDMQALVTRLIHACGMVDVADRLAFSPGAGTAGQAALARGAAILCDCEMVAAGIIRRNLPARNDVVVTLNDPVVPALADRIGNTRSAAAVELWRDRLAGAVVVIGNAPTALFHLLELLDTGAPKPALILGFPVGFVGAAESKAELAARPRGIPFVTLRGRRGGSAMAAAAVNALCLADGS